VSRIAAGEGGFYGPFDNIDKMCNDNRRRRKVETKARKSSWEGSFNWVLELRTEQGTVPLGAGGKTQRGRKKITTRSNGGLLRQKKPQYPAASGKEPWLKPRGTGHWQSAQAELGFGAAQTAKQK